MLSTAITKFALGIWLLIHLMDWRLIVCGLGAAAPLAVLNFYIKLEDTRHWRPRRRSTVTSKLTS